MKVGRYDIIPIECGELGLDGGAMFGVVPKTLWQKSNPADEKNRITLAMRAMLIQREGMNILVDCGAGEKLSEKIQSIYAINYSKSSAESSLKKVGLNKEDITHVILTHLHFDHTGGATMLNGSGEITATYPNATYYVHQVQWDVAHDPSPRDKASYFGDNYDILSTNGQLQFIQSEGELFQDIETFVVNGHTPGQVLLKIKGENTTMLYGADLVPTSSHVSIPYVMAYDLEPLVTMKEKEKILNQAADEDWTLFYEHDPFRAATKVIKDEDNFRPSEEVNI